jgi:hypothetical protein
MKFRMNNCYVTLIQVLPHRGESETSFLHTLDDTLQHLIAVKPRSTRPYSNLGKKALEASEDSRRRHPERAWKTFLYRFSPDPSSPLVLVPDSLTPRQMGVVAGARVTFFCVLPASADSVRERCPPGPAGPVGLALSGPAGPVGPAPSGPAGPVGLALSGPAGPVGPAPSGPAGPVVPVLDDMSCFMPLRRLQAPSRLPT